MRTSARLGRLLPCALPDGRRLALAGGRVLARRVALAGLLVFAGGLALAGCAERPRPYRFGSPMLASADLPRAELAAPHAAPIVAKRLVVRTEGAPRRSEDRPAPAPAPHEVPIALGAERAHLPAPNRDPVAPEPAVRTPDDLRALVGRRDKRASFTVLVGWARALALRVPDATSGGELVTLAEADGRLAAPSDAAAPGDLLVFDHTEGELADLVAISLGRDARGVTEFIYAAGGVVRRGFADPHRPAMRRDADARVVNTFLRAGRRWPPKGTHYLAGELLAHVVRTR